MSERKAKLLGMTLTELQGAAVECGLKPFVGRQLADWLYGKRVADFDRMRNISNAAKQALSERFDLGTAAPTGRAQSSDGTCKYLFPVSTGGSFPGASAVGTVREVPGEVPGEAPGEVPGGASGGLPAQSGLTAVESVVIPELSPEDDIGSAPRQGFVKGSAPRQGSVKGSASRQGSAQGGALRESRSEATQGVWGVGSPMDNSVIRQGSAQGSALRRTLCVSTQAGCRMHCAFCMTGRQGFHGNLDAAGILNQFLGVDDPLGLTNAVYMGMGEPMDNYEAVARSIEVLTAPWGFGWSPKRITVSTVGVIPTLRRFLDEQRCHLAVSLHNPFPDERLQMMPAQRAWPAAEVIDLLHHYDFSGQRRVSFEYTMFEGFNDDKRHADALIRLLRGLECRVNLIRFHSIPDFPYGCSSDRVMTEFRDRLNNNGIICTIRASRGEDILAACGMLAGKH